MTRWTRQAPGLYETADGMAYATLIPAHWELVTVEDPERGIDPDVTDHATLRDAQRAYDAIMRDLEG
jgi:hypothetical protein